jgi:hypothetical protein
MSPEVRTERGCLGVVGEKLFEEAPRLGRVVGVELAAGEPITRLPSLGHKTAPGEQLTGLARDADRLQPATKSECRLAETQQDASPLRALRRLVEKCAVAVRRGLPIAGGEAEFGVQARPARVRLREQLARRRTEPDRQKSKGGHRRLDESVLQGADVCLRVAPVGDLLLGQSGRLAGSPELCPDLPSQIPVLQGKAPTLNGSHAPENTPNSRQC